MIIECPKCKKRYRVNDSDVPEGGGPVRCTSCSNIFTIYKEPLDVTLVPVEEEVTAEPKVEEEPPEPTFESIEERRIEEERIVSEVKAPPEPENAKDVLMKSLQEEKEKVITEPPFPESWDEQKKDKHSKARRLARSLAKDILLYHKEEVQRGRQQGNLVELLGDEIKRSWKFYKQQVGENVVKEKNYFKEALNEIIANGEETFV
jgi:predicted Zn finger-like uncharacterized protein